MSNRPIGILDSGIGGLSVWKEIVRELPNESTVYIADSINCPYGSRPGDEIYTLSKRLVEFLLTKDAKLIVVACNTITVSSLDKLRTDFPQIPIIGMVPVVKTAVEQTKNRKIGILSTVTTANSEYQKNLIKKFAYDCEVVNLGTDKLVPLIERGELGDKLEKVLKNELDKFIIKNIDILALGCSHFPLIKDKIQKIIEDNVLVLDSAGAIVRQIRRVLENENLISNNLKPTHEIYTTGDFEQFKKTVKMVLGRTDRDFAIIRI